MLEMDQQVPFTYQQRVRVRLSGLRHSTEFDSEFIGSEGQQAIFSLPPAFARYAGDANARVRGVRIPMQEHLPSGFQAVDICEMGLTGLGYLSTKERRPGEEVEMLATLGEVQTRFVVRVAFCRPITREASKFLINGLIIDFPRVDMMRWKREMERHAA